MEWPWQATIHLGSPNSIQQNMHNIMVIFHNQVSIHTVHSCDICRGHHVISQRMPCKPSIYICSYCICGLSHEDKSLEVFTTMLQIPAQVKFFNKHIAIASSVRPKQLHASKWAKVHHLRKSAAECVHVDTKKGQRKDRSGSQTSQGPKEPNLKLIWLVKHAHTHQSVFSLVRHCYKHYL